MITCKPVTEQSALPQIDHPRENILLAHENRVGDLKVKLGELGGLVQQLDDQTETLKQRPADLEGWEIELVAAAGHEFEVLQRHATLCPTQRCGSCWAC